MKTFQTQCTNCRHVFTISDSQLAFKNGLARCGHCKQIFSAKDNLISPTPLTESQKAALAQLQQQKNQPSASTSLATPSSAPASNDTIALDTPIITTKKQKRVKTGEGLISDDTVPDELASVLIADKPSQVPTDSGFSLDILEDFDAQPNLAKVTPAFQSEEPSLMNDNPKKNGDESWLEQMLADEEVKERDKSFLQDTRHNPVGAKSDVAGLLDDLGVDVVPEVALSQEAYIQKMSERLEHTTNSQQGHQKRSLLAPLLWGLGCLLLLGLLALQYVVFNVNDLMKDKNHAKTLTSICQATHLRCNLAQADLSSVDIKTLKVEENAGKTDIVFTLTNKSSEPVLYPNLKISLQSNNSSVGTLVLSPKQYGEDVVEEMAPQQITPIKLRVDITRNSFDQALIESFY